MWKEVIKRGNLLTHTYPWEQEILIKELKEAIKVSDELMDIYKSIKEKIKPYLKDKVN